MKGHTHLPSWHPSYPSGLLPALSNVHYTDIGTIKTKSSLQIPISHFFAESEGSSHKRSWTDSTIENFEGITFEVFVKLNSLCNMFAEYVNRFKCNSSGELPDDGSLYFTDILKPLYKKCNGSIFEPAEMRDYLEILNICIANKTLKIKENKIGYACAVIYAISTHSSEDRSYLEGWGAKIVEKLKIDPNTYKQRKSDIKNGLIKILA